MARPIRYWPTGDGAQAPQRNRGAALDLHVRLPGRGWRILWGQAKLSTGIALDMPEDAVVRITGRSGAFLRGFIVHDGLVESEFNGRELSALVYCPWPRIVRHGDRIAQMWALDVDRQAFQRADQPSASVQASIDSKEGFGSTGR